MKLLIIKSVLRCHKNMRMVCSIEIPGFSAKIRNIGVEKSEGLGGFPGPIPVATRAPPPTERATGVARNATLQEVHWQEGGEQQRQQHCEPERPPHVPCHTPLAFPAPIAPGDSEA